MSLTAERNPPQNLSKNETASPNVFIVNKKRIPINRQLLMSDMSECGSVNYVNWQRQLVITEQ